jgi:soluble lytic murein transglycosylase-like protein
MVRISLLTVLATASLAWWPANRADGSDQDQFVPRHRLEGIGVGRKDLDEAQFAYRTAMMIEAQTFSILRDPQALAGAQRITSVRMQRLFQTAEKRSGMPASLIAAVAYLESWGNPKAQSPTGPRGIMQVSAGTARNMGLRMIYATRYRVTTVRRKVRTKKGRTVTRVVRERIPYRVLVRDERLVPERAIPAAAVYLSRLEEKFGGRDWAIFAYHCGEGCVASMQQMLANASGVKTPLTVAKMFFSGNPAHNNELYEAVDREMSRDYSPTYWFRVMRAQQLLDLYKKDPARFKKLFEDYRYEADARQRAPHRLSVWLRSKDLEYQNCEDLRREQGRSLARAFDDEDFYGFKLRKDLIGAEDPDNAQYYLQATPAAIGTLTYIAYETRRLHAAMKPKGEKYVPLEVTSLVQPLDAAERKERGRDEALWHCTGQVFDIDYRSLPVGEREALDFVLHDLGWMGYLGFVEETRGGGTLHIGSSPSSRDFFGAVFEDAVAAGAARRPQT